MDFIDLKTQYKRIENPLRKRIDDIFSNARFIMGNEISELETELANYVGSKHCVTCSSGTDALVMALMAAEIRPGDRVFVPTFTFFATAEAVSLVGAAPIFIDCEPDSFNMDPGKLEEAVTDIKSRGDELPKAVIPADLFGLAADYRQIGKVADDNDMILIEDAAQSFGASIGGKKAGSFGDLAATSFFPAKPLGCYGDGGAVFTDSDEYADILRSIRVHGQGKDKYESARIGLNARLDTVQAAVLLEKLKIFDDELERKRAIAAEYNRQLSEIITAPVVGEKYESCWAQYSVLAGSEGERQAIIDGLKAAGIPTAVYYKLPLHMQKPYRKSPYLSAFDYSVSEDVSLKIFSLPMHAYLGGDDIELITSTIKNII